MLVGKGRKAKEVACAQIEVMYVHVRIQIQHDVRILVHTIDLADSRADSGMQKDEKERDICVWVKVDDGVTTHFLSQGGIAILASRAKGRETEMRHAKHSTFLSGSVSAHPYQLDREGLSVRQIMKKKSSTGLKTSQSSFQRQARATTQPPTTASIIK